MKAQDEERIHGVRLAIKSSLLEQLPDLFLPPSTNDRWSSISHWIPSSVLCSSVHMYWHWLDVATGTLYEDLNNLVKAVIPEDISMGDFNVIVSTDYTIMKGTLGPHGTGNMNFSDQLLLSLCAENNLKITNTLFRQAHKYKSTGIHQRSKQ